MPPGSRTLVRRLRGRQHPPVRPHRPGRGDRGDELVGAGLHDPRSPAARRRLRAARRPRARRCPDPDPRPLGGRDAGRLLPPGGPRAGRHGSRPGADRRAPDHDLRVAALRCPDRHRRQHRHDPPGGAGGPARAGRTRRPGVRPDPHHRHDPPRRAAFRTRAGREAATRRPPLLPRPQPLPRRRRARPARRTGVPPSTTR